jgi:hypothetical protein
MLTVRKNGHRAELDALWAYIACIHMLVGFSTFDDAGIGDGTTAGRLRTNASVDFRVAGLKATKASTDDLWNLSAETDTTASQYRAYWLYLNAAGTASIAAGSNAASAADALAALPDIDEAKSVIGVFVAAPSCDFDGAGGLAAQGTIYDGIPEGVPCGVPTKTYSPPETLDLIAP